MPQPSAESHILPDVLSGEPSCGWGPYAIIFELVFLLFCLKVGSGRKLVKRRRGMWRRWLRRVWVIRQKCFQKL